MRNVALWLLVEDQWVKLGVVAFKGEVEAGGGWKVTEVNEDDEDEETLEIESPLTNLEQMAAAHHEIFIAYVNAGFTNKQALELVKAGIESAMGED